MGLFSKLFKKDGEKPTEKNKDPFKKDYSIGKTDACPYCNEKLAIIPSRKKKCPHCGEFILVRTRPQDRKRILVTLKQVKQLEAQWAQYYEDKERKDLMQNPDFANAEKELTQRFGKKAALNDVKWSVYNQRIIEFASKRQWGLYRNNKLDMARVLEKEKRYNHALSTLFEVCYLDLNGCNNIGLINGQPMSREESDKYGIKDFDTSTAFLAPGIISMIKDLMLQTKISKTDAKKLFIEINEKTKPMKNMPVNTEQAWKKLAVELKKD